MRTSRIEHLALRATETAERWMPDAFVFALGATLIALVAAFGVDPAMRAEPTKLVLAWGNGFWSLVPFTLQMSMVIVSGYVLASSPPVRLAIRAVAGRVGAPKRAVATVALLAMLSSLLNWGFSLIFSAMLVREVARRRPDVDYRALAASGFLGLGTVWAQGLSGSAALQMASASSLPKALTQVVGAPIPLTETIFRPQSLVAVLVELLVVTALAWAYAPSVGTGAAALGIDLGDDDAPLPPPTRPGELLEHRGWLLFPVVLLGFLYLGLTVSAKATTVSDALNAIDFNTVNFFFLMLGALFHRTPASLMRAVRDATPAIWGVLLQFPFYAGIFGLMTGTVLSERIADVFVDAAAPWAYPPLILAYSTLLGLFVPSGGGKWVIEAPYVLGAARTLGVPDGWAVVTYDLGEAVANLCQPFWMLPILALLGLRARDIMGYTFLVAVVVFPLTLVLVTVLAPG